MPALIPIVLAAYRRIAMHGSKDLKVKRVAAKYLRESAERRLRGLLGGIGSAAEGLPPRIATGPAATCSASMDVLVSGSAYMTVPVRDERLRSLRLLSTAPRGHCRAAAQSA